MKRRARGGFVLGLVMVLLTVAIAALQARAMLDAETTRDVAGGELTQVARAVALAAADERLLAFARGANDPASGELFGCLRSTVGKGALDPASGSWALPDRVRGVLVAAPLDLTAKLIVGFEGDPKNPDVDVQVESTQVDVVITARSAAWPSGEVRGRLIVRAVASARRGRRAVEQGVQREQAFRIARLGMPWPFDRFGLFVRESTEVLGAAPNLAQPVMDNVRRVREYMAGNAGQAPGKVQEAMKGIARACTMLEERWEKLENRVDRRTMSHLIAVSGEVPDLSALDVAAVARERGERCNAAGLALNAAMKKIPQDKGAAFGPAAQEFVDAAQAFQDDTTRVLTEGWGGLVGYGTIPDYERAIAAVVAEAHDSRAAWFRTPELSKIGGAQMGDLCDDGEITPAGTTNGVIDFLNAPSVVDDGAVWGGLSQGQGGRVVLRFDRSVRVTNLSAPPGGLVTIVGRGKITIAGTVRASIIALNGLVVEPGARIVGNVYHHGGELKLGAGASLRMQSAIKASLTNPDEFCQNQYHVALDPSVTTRRLEVQ